MVAFGATYLVVGKLASASDSRSASSLDLWLCVAGLVGMFCCGYAGYFVVDAVWPEFYYKPVQAGKNAWLLAQLACVISYLVGAVLVRSRVKTMIRSVR